MKIWEIDRTVTGGIYRIGQAGRAWTVNDKREVVLKSNGSPIEEYHSLATILEFEFEEYKQPKQFSEDEKIIVSNFDALFRYITRDKDDNLVIHSEQPSKYVSDKYYWASAKGGTSASLIVLNHLFQQIQWSDEEPTLIADIIK